MSPPFAALSLRMADRVTPETLQWFTDELRGIPRPPRALHPLVSPEFITQASSAELSDLVMSEPLAAAKVTAKVHSPLYGLREPVSRIGQAITFIGTTSVRDIGLPYLLEASFQSDSVQVHKMFETLGEASTLDSELSLRLAPRLRLPDAGSVMTLVDHVAAIDRVLETLADATQPPQAAVLALGYLSASIGERLAHGQMDDLGAVDVLLDCDSDFHHLNGYRALPALRDLRQTLRTPDLLADLRPPPQGLTA